LLLVDFLGEKMLKQGDKAPQFSLKDQDGRIHNLRDYLGKKVVLYFYPKDLTPGCAAEACSFRDDFDEIKKKNAVIIGISNDSVESHKRFEKSKKLNFILLSDPEKKIVQDYGVYGEKSFLGKKFKGINRTTFLIDERGVISKIYPKVDVRVHSKEILDDL